MHYTGIMQKTQVQLQKKIIFYGKLLFPQLQLWWPVATTKKTNLCQSSKLLSKSSLQPRPVTFQDNQIKITLPHPFKVIYT